MDLLELERPIRLENARRLPHLSAPPSAVHTRTAARKCEDVGHVLESRPLDRLIHTAARGLRQRIGARNPSALLPLANPAERPERLLAAPAWPARARAAGRARDRSCRDRATTWSRLALRRCSRRDSCRISAARRRVA